MKQARVAVGHIETFCLAVARRVFDLGPGDLALVAFGRNGQRGGEPAFINFRGFVTQRQRPEPVGDEVPKFYILASKTRSPTTHEFPVS